MPRVEKQGRQHQPVGAADGDAAVHTAAETPAPAKQGSKRGFFS